MARGVPLPDHVQVELTALVDELGRAGACRVLHVPLKTLWRAQAGRPLTKANAQFIEAGVRTACRLKAANEKDSAA